MAKEKGTTSSSGDKKKSTGKSTGPNIISIFVVGAIIGLASGFFLGWWYPAPSAIRKDIDTTKSVARDKMENIARQARDKTADLLEERAQQLRHPLGHVSESDETDLPPLSPIQSPTSVPVE